MTDEELKQVMPEIDQKVWELSTLLWVVENGIRNEKGVLLEFINHRFLMDIYDDMAQIQVIRKASQVGYSTMMILKSLKLAKNRKYNIIYTLPTFGDVGQFVPSKVNALISNNEMLQEWTKDKDTILQKKVGDGFIYYRGTFSKKGESEKMESGVGIMFSSDINIHDECDRSDQTILEQYESRLSNSEYGGRWYFSNPTSPYTLSQKLFEKSDQKHWFIKCEHCNKWQYLDYWKNIKYGKFICEACGKLISDDVRRNGRWVKKYANRDISGYWISHLICPWISAEKIQEEEQTKTKQYFYNFILGLPYIGSDVVVNKDILLKCIDLGEPNFKQHNVLGVDQGLKKHYVLMNSQGIFKLGVMDRWEDIEELIKIYDVETAVIDALPDLTIPRKLRDKYPGIVWLNYFKREIKRADYILWDYKTHTVFSDRTKIIQNTIDKFINREIRIQLMAEDLTDYIKHWQALYKVVESDKMGIEQDVWESSGEDHYVFATIYALTALEKTEHGGTEIKDWEQRKEIYSGLAPDIKKMLEDKEAFENG